MAVWAVSNATKLQLSGVTFPSHPATRPAGQPGPCGTGPVPPVPQCPAQVAVARVRFEGVGQRAVRCSAHPSSIGELRVFQPGTTGPRPSPRRAGLCPGPQAGTSVDAMTITVITGASKASATRQPAD